MGLTPAFSQERPTASLLDFRYGFQVPMGDLHDRFGGSMGLGASYHLVKLKSRFFVGADAIYYFGNIVKEDVLADLRSFDGSIIGQDGRAGDVNLKERGYYAGLHLGKIFPFNPEKNKLTGILVQAGAGFLQHKIRVQDNRNSIKALNQEFLHGYDRLSNGPAIHLSAGFHYEHPVNNFLMNITADVYGGRTKSRRDFDNVAGGPLTNSRTDLLTGLTLSYVVLISRQSSPEHIYY
jgi:hypothetical protein